MTAHHETLNPPQTAAGQALGAMPCSTFVRTFQPRFARLVERGEKCQTIRKVPKRIPQPGDILDAREWTGKPYRSPQRKLGRYRIYGVCACFIDEQGIRMQPPPGSVLQIMEVPIMGLLWSDIGADQFARADGFRDAAEMRQWFLDTHGFPVDGIVIYWSNK